MEHLSDKELLDVIRQRLAAKDRAYGDLKELTARLEDLNIKLVESERVKSSFLSNIRNEINNPLTAVLTMAELVVSGNEAPDYETLKTIAALIHKEAFSLNFQLRNIFAAAELEAGEAVPSFSGADIDSILKDITSSFSHRAIEKNVIVDLDISGRFSVTPFRTDAEKVHRVVSNLLSNAIEFSPENSRVSLKAAEEDGWLCVSVADNGPGIDPARHGTIFERFRQLDMGASKKHLGHGLGLSIVKATVDMLGGQISVDSCSGKGAVFTVLIPEADAAASNNALCTDGAEFFMPAEAERF
ncbi:MAG: hypothetical protein A2054_00665 [Deltaproteobacteria bacterium GWA2_55_10]|nr:MAG: hypothetical protein A2054_00665 [Deltaproteobacteria bacterium GWA2_55_10]